MLPVPEKTTSERPGFAETGLSEACYLCRASGLATSGGKSVY